jgi:hypothetical protein
VGSGKRGKKKEKKEKRKNARKVKVGRLFGFNKTKAGKIIKLNL